jgi:hydrophobic/amphiphilic exporter-1 (mainly G- bacteria), HAE1 family
MIKFAMTRPVTVFMFFVATILFGIVSLDRLALNLLPDISYPSLTIQTDYPDAAPEEVESLITRPIEESVGVVPGLARLSSVSRSGQSEVVLEFAWKTNMDLVALDVREKLDVVDLPRDVERPVILRFDPSYDPIMRLQLYGDLSLSRLRYSAEKEIKKNLESTEGVAAIKVIGGLEEQIRIEIDEKRLAELQIPITQVTQILAQENLNQASGSLYDLDANYLVRMLNQFRSVEEIQQIIIRNQDGRQVVLGDVAKVWRGSKDREIIARLNGKESVEMAIYKEGDANTVTVAQAVSRRLESLKKANQFARGVDYQIVFNQAEFIKNAVDDVQSSAILGGLLAIIVLYVFLRDLRSTLTIGLSIPISIMATFALMYQTDIALNIMSLGGIALGVGTLVDNSIVVLEAVHRHRTSDKTLFEAVYNGAKEVGTAVSASTLTTVVVFLPMIFVEGIAGQLFKDQALTITYSLMVSMLVALTLLPMILSLQAKAPTFVSDNEPTDQMTAGNLSSSSASSRFRRIVNRLSASTKNTLHFLTSDLTVVIVTDLRRLLRLLGVLLLKLLRPILDGWHFAYNRLSKAYPRRLLWALNNKASVIGLCLFLSLGAGILCFQIGAELIPPLTQGEFAFEIRLPEGKPLQETDRLISDIEGKVGAYPQVQTVFSSVGGSNKNQFARESHEENVGQLFVVMKNKQDKGAESSVINRIRGQLEEYPEVTFTFSRPTLFSFKTPVEVEIYTYDLTGLHSTAEKVASHMRQIAGLSDIKTSTELGSPELHILFDRDRLARLGLEESQVANILRNKIRGDVASRYREEDKQIEILVRAHESDRNTIEDIRNLVINMGAAISTNPRMSVADRLAALNSSQGGRALRRDEQDLREEELAAPNRSSVPSASVVPIRLGSVADVVIARGPSEVRRIRSQRAAVVSANLSGRDLTSVSDEIRRELQLLRSEIPENTTIGLGGQNEELEASYKSLVLALALAVFLVYLVMACQFESLLHPFIIMFTVPLGLIGVVFTLFITQTTFNVMVFLGLIILAGIVVNNAIVLIDYANQLRQQGLSKREALLKAGEVRLRPILMTTLTTVLGLIPMALGWGEGAEVRAPMAITVMGGLSFCTLLTLFLIPVIYEMIDRKVYAADAAAEVSVARFETPMVGRQESTAAPRISGAGSES